jgi:pyruvate/2-oxoglutarate dehydrogenase complex dihydrolipoamide dehydrogenase (E3) component
MDARGIRQMLSTKTLSIAKDGVTVEKDGETSVVRADTVMYSTGIHPNTEAVEAVKALAGEIPVKVIGDALKSGKMGDAIRGGYMAVMEIL